MEKKEMTIEHANRVREKIAQMEWACTVCKIEEVVANFKRKIQELEGILSYHTNADHRL